MIRKAACPKYPTGVKKRVEGDWNCVKCSNLNFAFRSMCNRCGVQKANAPIFHWAVFLTPPSFKDMPWLLGECETLPSPEIPSVSPFLEEKCMLEPTKVTPLIERALFPDSSDQSTEPMDAIDVDALLLAEILAGVKRPLIEREGDWKCESCCNLNFAFRSECNRCHLSKP